MKFRSKIAIIGLLSLTICNGSIAQQQSQYSQYLFNGYCINPAFAGINNQLQALAGYRTQWSGIDGAPVDQIVSVTSPFGKGKHGVGILLSHEKIGLHTSNTISASYAYFIQSKKSKIGFSLRPVLYMYSLNAANATVFQGNDPSAITISRKKNILSADFGFAYTSRKMFFGFSTTNLDEQKLLPQISTSPFYFEVKRHLFTYAGYQFDISPKFMLMPSLLVKYVNNAPVNFDINSLFIFSGRWVTGLSYRSSQSLNLNFQYWHNSIFKIGYMFDYPLNGLNNITPFGTHEIFLGYTLVQKDKPMVTPRFL